MILKIRFEASYKTLQTQIDSSVWNCFNIDGVSAVLIGHLETKVSNLAFVDYYTAWR